MREIWPNGEPVQVGQHVEKRGGDYQFDGRIVAAFQKRSGVWRYVVEDDRGVLHVYSLKHLGLIGNCS